jgi:hypothetical protein
MFINVSGSDPLAAHIWIKAKRYVENSFSKNSGGPQKRGFAWEVSMLSGYKSINKLSAFNTLKTLHSSLQHQMRK